MTDLKKLADALASSRRWHELTDDQCDAAAAALREFAAVAAAQRVPEGMALVPLAPSAAMLQAACDVNRHIGGNQFTYRAAYLAMLAAAPPAPAAEPASPWIVTKERKPKGGQMIVRRWKNGAVWAGVHDEGPKNESFDWWFELPPTDQARKGG